MDSQASDSVAALYLQQESIATTPAASNNNTSNPLHVAASLGLPNFVREIVDQNPELALSFDERGLTPCHLAVANGHISAVKELLASKVGVDICQLRDKGGFLPIHTALMKGRVDVFLEVKNMCHSLSMFRESTWQGDSIIHLAIKFGSLEAFQQVLPLFRHDKELINSKDAQGNTLLHLAVTRRQPKIVKMLMGKIEVNALDQNGSTALDICFNLEHEKEDMTVLREMIRKACGRRAAELEVTSQPQPDQLELGESKTQPPQLAVGNILFHLDEMWFNFRRFVARRVPRDKDRETSNTLMVVATLIATITFQGTLNPPGGFIQGGSDEGKAVLEKKLKEYLFYNIMAFISSLSVIMLTIYAVPRWKDLIKLTMFIIWVSVYFTMACFQLAIHLIFPTLSIESIFLTLTIIGDVVVLIFAVFMFGYTWYLLRKGLFTFFQTKSPEWTVRRPKKVVITCLSALVAALIWLPFPSYDLLTYFIPQSSRTLHS